MGKRSKDDPVIEDLAEFVAVGPDGEIIPIEDVPPTVGDLITEVADSVVLAARSTGTTKFGVEFGIRVRRDGTVALADETAKATFKVFMEWSGHDAG